MKWQNHPNLARRPAKPALGRGRVQVAAWREFLLKDVVSTTDVMERAYVCRRFTDRGYDATPSGHLTFLVTEFGKPFAVAGFGNWFREQCDIANLHHCSFHGLRKAASVRLAEAGCTPHEIAAITGHASLKEIVRYTQTADRKRLAAAAMEKVKARTSSGQPIEMLAKKKRKALKDQSSNLRVAPRDGFEPSTNRLTGVFEPFRQVLVGAAFLSPSAQKPLRYRHFS